ncbi:MAG: hypothetical protein HKO57_12320, partial [Akkermansiaceae bacterium]|nr:hypothetical protein [Akkermansiaceae bacterium]
MPGSGPQTLQVDAALDAAAPQAAQLRGVPETPRREVLAPRPSQVREDRVQFVARNRIEEPEQWLPETPSPRGRPTTRAGKRTQTNWLPVILSVVAVTVLAIAITAIVMEGHRRTAVRDVPQSEPAR